MTAGEAIASHVPQLVVELTVPSDLGRCWLEGQGDHTGSGGLSGWPRNHIIELKEWLRYL